MRKLFALLMIGGMFAFASCGGEKEGEEAANCESEATCGTDEEGGCESTEGTTEEGGCESTDEEGSEEGGCESTDEEGSEEGGCESTDEEGSEEGEETTEE